MYASDLSSYARHSYIFPHVKAVGWLDADHLFTNGPAPGDVVQKLRAAMIGKCNFDIHVNRIRGVHPCNLCGVNEFEQSDLGIGSTQIWIPNSKGKFYASPSMIIHYIGVHHYLPPAEFIDALRLLDLDSRFIAQEVYDELAEQVMNS